MATARRQLGYVSSLTTQNIPVASGTTVDVFTSSGTWTVPAGVAYAIAHMIGGGGGIGSGAGGGGDSTVAFAGGTVTAVGGPSHTPNAYNDAQDRAAGTANSGRGAKGRDLNTTSIELQAADGAYIVAGDTVTPGASITVTVGGAGGAGVNGAAGGTGVVWIEYGVNSPKRVASFKSNGTWTVPSGVTYAVAHMRGGGGGVSTGASAGGNSSVAFAGGTVTAYGGSAMTRRTVDNVRKLGAPANSGGFAQGQDNAVDGGHLVRSVAGGFVVAGGAVTAGASITVTVGAAGGGGSDNAPSGGSGFVWIEYDQV